MQVIENAKANTQTDIELIEHNQIWAKYRLILQRETAPTSSAS